VIDGSLDEALWADAVVIDQLLHVSPHPDAAACLADESALISVGRRSARQCCGNERGSEAIVSNPRRS